MTTVYGWDTSSHDDTPTSLDGLSFFTCKITDGDHWYENSTATAKLTAMRDFGCPILGTYHVLWGNASIANQAAWYIQTMDKRIPWWRDFPYWICQSDNEPFGYNVKPTISQINEFHDRVIDLSNGKLPFERHMGYTPQWVYGAGVAQQKVAWWQSNYGTNPTGWYQTVYNNTVGNSSSKWNGPKEIMFLQYGSNTTIAGQTTSDANAFRGSLEDLKKVLGGGEDDMTPEQNTMLYNTAQLTYEALILGNDTMGASLFLGNPPVQTDAIPIKLVRKVNDLMTKVTELEAKIDALQAGSGLTYEQTVQAAFEGAQKAETE